MKSLLLIIFLAFASVSFAQDVPANMYEQQVEAYISEKKYDEAKIVCTEWIKLEPESAERVQHYLLEISSKESEEQLPDFEGQPATEQHSPSLCENYRDINVQAVYLCKNAQNEDIYLEQFMCEDCINRYYNADKTFIADCCVAMCIAGPSEECLKLQELQCDFSVNLYPDLCETNIRLDEVLKN